MTFRQVISSILMFALCLNFRAQENSIHQRSTSYEWPKDQLVVQNLKKWQDLKFGVLLHWGIYAVPGIVESWSICDEDWIKRDTTRTYQEYMDWYFGLADEFCPTKFDPAVPPYLASLPGCLPRCRHEVRHFHNQAS